MLMQKLQDRMRLFWSVFETSNSPPYTIQNFCSCYTLIILEHMILSSVFSNECLREVLSNGKLRLINIMCEVIDS